MASFTSKFKLNVPRQTPTEPNVNNESSQFTWNLAEPGSSPTFTSIPQKRYGDFSSDSLSGQYTLSWRSWEEFISFLGQEQASHSIELRKVSTKSGAERYVERIEYVCARYGTGGEKPYDKKHPEWSRKVPNKSIDCACSLKVKTYHGTSTVLGKYKFAHNHPTGVDNLRFTQISKETRDWIAAMVRMKVKSQHILEMAHNIREKQAFDGTEAPGSAEPAPHRNDFIMLADVRRIEKAVEAETVRLERDDGPSVFLWAEKLRAADSLLGFKSCVCPVPLGSGLLNGTMSLMVQTPSQRKQFHTYGHGGIIFIDGTHNITMYKNTTLTTILVRDNWGHGIPVAWMIASNGTEETISYFLLLLRNKNPQVVPWRFMSDRDLAQINAILCRYPESPVWLCWWHVLHAWQQHFAISQNELLWTRLKALVRLEYSTAFDDALVEIKGLAPPAFWDYFLKTWLPIQFVLMWSAVYRQNRSVKLLSDTNMLIEAWHHVLKGKFLEGRRNRRLDHLVHVLVELVLPYYALKERRQQIGFEGENLENQKRSDVIKMSQTFKTADIELQTNGSSAVYLVKSASRPTHWYKVDLLAYTCTCPDYPVIQLCKHLYAVQTFYPSASDSDSLDRDDQSTNSSAKDLQVQNVTGTAGVETDETTSEGSRLVGLGLDVACNGPPGSSLPEEAFVMRNTMEKFERFMARFRLHGTLEQARKLDAWLDHELLQEPTSLLPSKQKLSPRLNSWPETRAAMIPAPKTRAKRAGDQAYGAGESSGKKAKTLPKPDAPPATLTTILPNQNPTLVVFTMPSSSIGTPIVPVAQSQPSSSYYRPKTHLY